jgi:chromosomal replication initiation ATPase DnaA
MIKEALTERLKALLNTNYSIEEIQDLIDSYSAEDYVGYPELIINASKAVGIAPKILVSKSRKREAVIGRSLIYKEMKEQGYTYQSIGRRFLKDHASVIHGIKSLESDLEVGWKPVVDAVDKFKRLNGEDIHTLHNEEERTESL